MNHKTFEVIPAIDLKEGRCVRLSQGRLDEATIYGDDPASMAEHWQSLGAKRLHVVDLDGAFAGNPENLEAIQAICKRISIPVQLGGGLRNLTTIKAAFALGVDRVILGSAAASNPVLVSDACHFFPHKVCVGIDARNGKVAVQGWGALTDSKAVDLARRFEDIGVAAIIYTDIQRDGMLTGPNVDETVSLARAVNIPIIASGGIASLKDLQTLATHVSAGICGAITGRAIYEGRLDFAAAMTRI
ncbi:MAG: 1-(5-phosphoribosyl)-5-[(5-phosphoribosylamino)methylideneamino]imidazole-4-carboxamide isomerase [Mariprofundaceae bacterium]